MGDGGAGFEFADRLFEWAEEGVEEVVLQHADRAGEGFENGAIGFGFGDEGDIGEVGEVFVETFGDVVVIERGDKVWAHAVSEEGFECGLDGDDDDAVADAGLF